MERHSTLLTLVDSLQSLLDGGPAMFAVLAVRLPSCIKDAYNDMVETIKLDVADIGPWNIFGPEWGRSMNFKHFCAELPQKLQERLLLVPDSHAQAPGVYSTY